jgi:flagellar hook assembly protein FlgD
LRKLALALTLSLVAATGMFAPPAEAAVGPKIVIIVGAVHGSTDSYRSRGNAAYAEAIKYSSNVIKVFSPNATWSKVKAAMQGANIVIYMGHGNGFPSPYRTTPWPYSQNGFGLNASLGNGDHNNTYYGEHYIGTEVKLAPNAIVLLHHLCYASGNSEPGKAAPSASVARQRVDNYAAGFIKAGARAVIAEGHRGPEGILRALFTTHQTIEQLWRTQSNFHNNVTTFASSRSAGFTAYTDTDSPNGGYYRSMVAMPSTTTDEIVSGGVDTGGDPADFIVPGNAEVTTDGAPLYEETSLQAEPTTTVAAGTRLRVVQRVNASADGGGSLLEVVGLDDGSIAGFMAATDLVPRDSRGPLVLGVDTGIGRFSPNGDGVSDTITVGGRLSENASWRVRFTTNGGSVLAERTGSGRDLEATWDGRVGGTPVGGGTYKYEIRAEDAWGNTPATFGGSFVADLTPPTLASVVPGSDPVEWFSPNGDTVKDTFTLSGAMSEAGSIAVRIRDASDTTVRTFTVNAASGGGTVTWNGKDGAGAVVPDGTYIVRLTPKDTVGNQGAHVTRTVQVVGMLGFVTSSKARIYPQDEDRLAKSTVLSFGLARPATVTWTLRNAADEIVETRYDATPLEAGTWSWTFDGRTPDGTMLPRGTYRSHVVATDGTLTAVHTKTFEMNAFTIRTSTTAPKRGQKVTVTAISAEALSTQPRVYIDQPGKATWSVAMTKTAALTFRATFTLKTGGSAGTVSFTIVARDKDGRKQSTTRSLGLR